MGFSVSGATAILLIGGLIAFSFAFTAANNGFQSVSDAHDDRSDRFVDQQNTGIEIANATYDGDASELIVAINNTGSTTISIDEISLLIEGRYAENASTSVDGDENTTVVLAGEQLTTIVGADDFPGGVDQPDRVKVVTSSGVGDTFTEVQTDG